MNGRLIPPDDPRAPKYWRDEASGILRPVVSDYLAGKRLSPAQIMVMQGYLWQWVNSPVWKGAGALEALRLRVAAIASCQDVTDSIAHAVALGMDPL